MHPRWRFRCAQIRRICGAFERQTYRDRRRVKRVGGLGKSDSDIVGPGRPARVGRGGRRRSRGGAECGGRKRRKFPLTRFWVGREAWKQVSGGGTCTQNISYPSRLHLKKSRWDWQERAGITAARASSGSWNDRAHCDGGGGSRGDSCPASINVPLVGENGRRPGVGGTRTLQPLSGEVLRRILALLQTASKIAGGNAGEAEG